ncbi:exodeoxyribonuclease V alpha chain (plasmid) [Synechocystis sp. PCC 6803]|uniref:Exodeoxyribonuclease V alpha chain n=1 Tax=Synechocystis sp. (strain ATCC 27184 / PCC 6803 / Kazusa) TaxID=1111708 RepID=Q6ZE92_SYNY3|nr:MULTISPECIES: AAA family ATPase [unclassified Synechocystis]MBD2620111.1 AAA family ATPase [Synechocystis sp. FACHB-898]MBD2640758.1 AAA family ATPase [Synechocystis sp. FACHB-908]MBD2662843.1 AAA family ATPase [Synechocystis sp. FACHB-929]AGF53557.1 exodeoxyribonuclease V alpha chain [Synechocystis sp. PCC 6803]AVP91414.1 ATP-dependent RecD-like DNA helicase [Synechocystis sp. IPPAS B-1465]
MEKSTDYLTGVIERITFHSEETGYTVARLQMSRAKELTTVVGNFANIQAGQTLKLAGIWKEHPKYGSQFQVNNYHETKPATLTGIEKYLGSGLIKGVGPVTAKRIVAHFGLETLEIIEGESDRLMEVTGIGKKRVRMIQRAWAEQKAIKEVMLFLQGHGVSTTYAVKIYKEYGDDAIRVVTHNPYQLADDIFGIGFLTADKIAQQVGIDPTSKFRYRAGILHTLGEAAEQGHCYLPQPELIKAAIAKLSTEEYEAMAEALLAVIEEMVAVQDLIREILSEEEILLFKPTFYHTECKLAGYVKQKLVNSQIIDIDRVKTWINRYTDKNELELSKQQYTAVLLAATTGVMILTGGPGTGKTFTTRTIVALWRAMGKKIGLAAPTGRAAQRLGEMTGLEAKTLHRLLEFDPNSMGFKRNEDNPLPFDAVIVDESSMLDLFLAHSLLKAISPNTQLLLVGDIDQLPSVGPGSVLGDLIASEQITMVRLNQVFRQAAASAIIRHAHQINRGQYPPMEAISDQPLSDCLWHNGGTEPDHGVQLIGELLTDFIPKQGFNLLQDVQVLCPMQRGIIGARNLNAVVQSIVVSNKAETLNATVRTDNFIKRRVNRSVHSSSFQGTKVMLNII